MYNEFVGKHISYLHRYARRYYNKELEPYGFGGAQLRLLMPLYEMDGISQEKLAQTIKLDKTTIARTIKKLIDNGYVSREIDEKDRRSYRIFLTEKGKAIEPEMMNIFLKWEENLLSKFEDEERKYVLKIVEMMHENASEMIQDEKCNHTLQNSLNL